LLSYGAAVDQVKAQDEFLGLWTTLDILSNAPNGSTSEICKRISMLWTDGLEILKPTIDALAPIRNQFVHGGQFDTEYQAPSVILHRIAHDAVSRYCQLLQDLPSDADFDAYFASATVSDVELNRRKRVGEFVSRQRAMEH